MVLENETVWLVGLLVFRFSLLVIQWGCSRIHVVGKQGVSGDFHVKRVTCIQQQLAEPRTPGRMSAHQRAVEVLRMKVHFLDYIFAEYLYPVSIVFQFAVTGGIYAMIINGPHSCHIASLCSNENVDDWFHCFRFLGEADTPTTD